MDNLQIVYDRLLVNNNDTLSDVKLYRSEVYYARAAVQAATGIYLSIEEMDRYLTEENMQPTSPEIEYTVDEIYTELMRIIKRKD